MVVGQPAAPPGQMAITSVGSNGAGPNESPNGQPPQNGGPGQWQNGNNGQNQGQYNNNPSLGQGQQWQGQSQYGNNNNYGQGQGQYGSNNSGGNAQWQGQQGQGQNQYQNSYDNNNGQWQGQQGPPGQGQSQNYNNNGQNPNYNSSGRWQGQQGQQGQQAQPGQQGPQGSNSNNAQWQGQPGQQPPQVTPAQMALQKIAEAKEQQWREEYGEKASRLFVDECKSLELFRFNWGEMLGAAPTAIGLLGQCWIAASHPAAYAISLGKARPVEGWKFLSNRNDLSLRSALVDLCQGGGHRAFMTAGECMEILRITSSDIHNDENGIIKEVFYRIGRVPISQMEQKKFVSALDRMSTNSAKCAETAQTMRFAFSKWRDMVVELLSASEQQSGNYSSESSKIKVDIASAETEKAVQADYLEQTKEEAGRLAERLNKCERRLDKVTENIPQPWAAYAQPAVESHSASIPSVIGSFLPMAASMLSPGLGLGLGLLGGGGGGAGSSGGGGGGGLGGLLGGLGSLAGGLLSSISGGGGGGGSVQSQAGMPANVGYSTGARGYPGQMGGYPSNYGGRQKPPKPPVVADKACDIATQLAPLLTQFYTFLGGKDGAVDWTKFETPSDIQWLQNTFNGHKGSKDLTDTEPSQKIRSACDTALQVVSNISQYMQGRKQNVNSSVPTQAVTSWKESIRTARDSIVALNAASNLQSGSSVPTGFAKVRPDVSMAYDPTGQSAQLSIAMQNVDTAQAALDLAQDKYDEALVKQGKTKSALIRIEKQLENLKSSDDLLKSLMSILDSCMFVLLDLCTQIQRIEDFFARLNVLITVVLLPKVENWKTYMQQTSEEAISGAPAVARFGGVLTTDEVTMQNIYILTLQMKAYFSLLCDIAVMYDTVHSQHIAPGLELLNELAKKSTDKDPIEAKQGLLNSYTSKTRREVDKLVNDKQKELIAGLEKRTQLAQNTTKRIQFEIGQLNLPPPDNNARQAITQGANQVKEEAKQEMQLGKPWTVLRDTKNAAEW